MGPADLSLLGNLELIRLARGGDRDAEAALLRRAHAWAASYVSAHIGGLSREDAEDVVQSTLLQFHLHWRLLQLAVEGSAPAWVCTTAHRIALRLLSGSDRRSVRLGDVDVPARAVAESAVPPGCLECLDAAAASLSQNAQAVYGLLFRAAEPLSRAGVADQIGLHETRVSQLKTEIRKSLLRRCGRQCGFSV